MDRSSRKSFIFLLVLLGTFVGISLYSGDAVKKSNKVHTLIGDAKELEDMNIFSLSQRLEYFSIYGEFDYNKVKDMQNVAKNIKAYRIVEGRPIKSSVRLDDNLDLKVNDGKGEYKLLNNILYDPEAFVEGKDNPYIVYHVNKKSEKAMISDPEIIEFTKKHRLSLERVEEYKGRLFVVANASEIRDGDKNTGKESNKIFILEVKDGNAKLLHKVDVGKDTGVDDRIFLGFDRINILTYADHIDGNKIAKTYIYMDLKNNKLVKEEIKKDNNARGIFLVDDVYDSYMKYIEKDNRLVFATKTNKGKDYALYSYKLKDGKLSLEYEDMLDLDNKFNLVELSNEADSRRTLENLYSVDVVVRGKKLVIFKQNYYTIEEGPSEKKEKMREDMDYQTARIGGPTQVYIYDMKKHKITYSGMIKGQILMNGRNLFLGEKQ